MIIRTLDCHRDLDRSWITVIADRVCQGFVWARWHLPRRCEAINFVMSSSPIPDAWPIDLVRLKYGFVEWRERGRRWAGVQLFFGDWLIRHCKLTGKPSRWYVSVEYTP